MRQYQQLPGLELPALSHNFTEYLVAHRLGSAHEAAAFTTGTWRTKQMFQAVARPFARHFHQAERRDAGDVRLRVVARQRALQRLHDLGAVRRVGHVDEIDDDDAAEVAQPS